MKLLFIEARKKIKPNEETKSKLINLPDSLLVYYTIQYKGYASQVKSFLERKGKKIKQFKQVLGCTRINGSLANCPILYIGSGLFHIYNITKHVNAYKADMFILEKDKLRKLGNEEIEELENKKKVALSRFYSADSVGIIVSCKPGQEALKKALRIKEKIEKKDKKPYIFIADNLDINELENFNINCWLNTACPGIALDSDKIINIGDINSL